MNKPIEASTLINSGKTKLVYEVRGEPSEVFVCSKDDMTAGDGKRHDVVPGKGAMSNMTTSNVFKFLLTCGLPVAFIKQVDDTTFRAKKCNMLPLEIVCRRRAVGSFIERNPHVPKLTVFPCLDYALFLKTSGKKWMDKDIPVDDPLMKINEESVDLFDPHKPIHGQKPFLAIPLDSIIGKQSPSLLSCIEMIARKTFLVLEKAYQLTGFELVDFKIEVGFDDRGVLRIADVIDAESVRLMRDGKHYDKQPYREDGLNPIVMERFAEVRDATSRFMLPNQRIIIWTGSKDDVISGIEDAVQTMSENTIGTDRIICSAHKSPVHAFLGLVACSQSNPDAVIIAKIGMSNGAGPTLSANTMLPVITIPANHEDHPEDIASCLRTPSKVPVMTMLSEKNAALAALQILAMHNPLLYAILRQELEKRLVNVVSF